MKQEILEKTITTFIPTFDFSMVKVHLKNGEMFQPILFGDIAEVFKFLTTPAENLLDNYNVVDTYTGERVIYKISEISHFEFLPEREENSPLIYKFG